jgi:hypothetical protein
MFVNRVCGPTITAIWIGAPAPEASSGRLASSSAASQRRRVQRGRGG